MESTYLRERAMIDHGYLDVIMGNQCNVECDYCTITREMRKQNMTTREIADALRSGIKGGLTAVSFGGGEPTMRKDLVPLVKMAKGLGYEHIKIQTNGLMFAYQSFVDELLDAGAVQFNISIMGRDRAMYKSIMGQEKYYDLVVEGIGNLVRRDARIVGDVIMKNDTYPRLADTIGTFAELGVQEFVLWLVSLTDRNKDHPESLVKVSEMQADIYKSFELGKRRGISVVSRHIPVCMLKDYPEHIWNVNYDKFLIVTPGSMFWLSESRITANTFVDKCEACAAKDTCMGIRKDYLDQFGDGEVTPL
jgi:molybdenum cofactor biosynthesis enzyme MoaA